MTTVQTAGKFIIFIESIKKPFLDYASFRKFKPDKNKCQMQLCLRYKSLEGMGTTNLR